MPTPYAAAVGNILANPLPILYLDTCIYLDIVRSPIRDYIDADSVRIAQSLLERANPVARSLWLVTSATVEAEWADNINSVLEETEREILKLEARRRHFLAAANAGTNKSHEHGLLETSLDLANKLRDLSLSLLNTSLIITPENNHILAAMNRVKQNLPPAKRGKAEPKDCEIYELFLGLCGDLSAQGLTQDFLFVSSNTKEYSDGNNGGVQPELNAVNGTYVGSLAWAEAKLTGRI